MVSFKFYVISTESQFSLCLIKFYYWVVHNHLRFLINIYFYFFIIIFHFGDHSRFSFVFSVNNSNLISLFEVFNDMVLINL